MLCGTCPLFLYNYFYKGLPPRPHDTKCRYTIIFSNPFTIMKKSFFGVDLSKRYTSSKVWPFNFLKRVGVWTTCPPLAKTNKILKNKINIYIYINKRTIPKWRKSRSQTQRRSIGMELARVTTGVRGFQDRCILTGHRFHRFPRTWGTTGHVSHNIATWQSLKKKKEVWLCPIG